MRGPFRRNFDAVCDENSMADNRWLRKIIRLKARPESEFQRCVVRRTAQDRLGLNFTTLTMTVNMYEGLQQNCGRISHHQPSKKGTN